jgi:hypothetical protein
VNGDGGLNVIAVNGDIKSSLILSGTANDTFIVNVTGTLTLGGNTTLGLAGGVTADHVLYNFVGASGSITTKVGNVLNGTLLAPAYSFTLDGTFNGEIIGGGSISLLSGAHVNQPAALASLSGFATNSGTHTAFAGVTITLTGTDSFGNAITLTTTTGADGLYSFTGLAAGTYTLTATIPVGYLDSGDLVGTVNGVTDGTRTMAAVLGNITLGAGQDGINYDFSFFLNNA